MEEIYPKWKGKPVVPSYHAAREMEGRFTLDDVVEILERGYDCPKSKRAKGTIEKCIKKKGKIIRIVAVEAYSTWIGGSVWLIKHIG
ncbi:MAG: hypothetical protein QME59_07840 [Candidatus Hydrothermarchaeota archaeon]|nr:hypothetical protein [Candidatus Hydrothermarchaeota archaeon]